MTEFVSRPSAHTEAGHYALHARDFYREMLAGLDRRALGALHRRSASRHLLLAARQILLLLAIPVLMWRFPSPWLWAPAILLQGFIFFGFSVLLHEVVHNAVFVTTRPLAGRALGLVYGGLGFLAPSQFARWHLDHHRELGSASKDPKRAQLSPKRNAVWLKVLYFSPLLAPIYFLASARAATHYPPPLMRRISVERLFVMVLHGTIFLALWFVSPWLALGAHLAPLAFAYPIAFSLNRLGQHYVVDPEWAGAWTTLMRPNPIWNFLFLYSSYHLEHHCFPGVPFYRLPELQRILLPVLTARGHRPYGYGELLHLWLLRNHAPHSRPIQP
ncbi:MAG: fatty acid desaturase [Tahibacter sp.]